VGLLPSYVRSERALGGKVLQGVERTAPNRCEYFLKKRGSQEEKKGGEVKKEEARRAQNRTECCRPRAKESLKTRLGSREKTKGKVVAFSPPGQIVLPRPRGPDFLWGSSTQDSGIGEWVNMWKSHIRRQQGVQRAE